MEKLKRIRYYTMNSWNQSMAPAYDLKVHNVIPGELIDKVYEMMDCENFYDNINKMIWEFGRKHDYEWQAGFNGRSGGYLVLYRGGKRLAGNSVCIACGQVRFPSVAEGGTKCGRCGNCLVIDKITYAPYTQSGMAIEDDEAPAKVRKAFDKLAKDIVKSVIDRARSCAVEDREVMVPRRFKMIKEI